MLWLSQVIASLSVLSLHPCADFRHVVHGICRAAAGDRLRGADPGEGGHVKAVVGREPSQGKLLHLCAKIASTCLVVNWRFVSTSCLMPDQFIWLCLMSNR